MTQRARPSAEEGLDRGLAAYLRQIARIPLRSKAEEIALAGEIRAGNEAAFRALVEANLRFVVMVARRYRGFGLSLLELIHEGNLGLVEAARRYSPDHEVKFITYAVWWIRQAMRQGLASGKGPVRLPLRPPRVPRASAGSTGSAADRRGSGHQTEDDDRAVTLLMGLSVGARLGRDGRTEDEASLALANSGAAPAADHELVRHAFQDEVTRMLGALTPREREVVSLRFGLGETEPETLEAVGRRFRLSRERVRQIESTAKRKMWRVAASRHLEDFLR